MMKHSENDCGHKNEIDEYKNSNLFFRH
jgi:hypothetical protein